MIDDAGKQIILKCDRCGCAHLDRYGGTTQSTGTMRRYRRCRNCGKRFLTTQPAEKIVREVDPRDDEDERTVLRVRTA